jgi:DNA-binding response OmpR family regulator
MGAKMTLCPCCRQELPTTARLTVSLDSNVAVARGHFVQLPPDQAVIAHELTRVWPSCLAYERIFFAVWGNNVPGTAETTVRTQITKLRHALKPLGYGIVVVWGEGYRLVDQQQSKNQVARAAG